MKIKGMFPERSKYTVKYSSNVLINSKFIS